MNMIIKYTIMCSSAYFKNLDDCFMFQPTEMFEIPWFNGGIIHVIIIVVGDKIPSTLGISIDGIEYDTDT